MRTTLGRTPLVRAAPIAADQEVGIVDGFTSEPYGTFNGIAYVKYTGQFNGLESAEYSVDFEIIAPAHPGQGNGITIMETLHPWGGAGGLKGYLTPEFLFERGFSHAGIGWYPVNPNVWYSTADAIEILHNFAITLRKDKIARGLVGKVKKLYSVGVSKTTEPLLALLASPDAGVLDFSFLFVPTLYQKTYSQHENANNIMVFLTEADFVRSVILGVHTDALRGSSPTYRSYEVAGGPHIPDVPGIRALFGEASEGTTPLDWTPVARALFLAGHRWTTEGTEPPPSVSFTEAPKGDIDSVYESQYGLELETGLARDENGNALGGIRLPDLEVGRGQYIALDPESFFGFGLCGAFKDLQCDPLPDGSSRFQDHTSYVFQCTQQSQTLVGQGFLLQEDADRWVAAATASNVGDAAACPPTSLPESGQAMNDGLPILLLALAGLLLIAAGLIFRQWGQASR